MKMSSSSDNYTKLQQYDILLKTLYYIPNELLKLLQEYSYGDFKFEKESSIKYYSSKYMICNKYGISYDVMFNELHIYYKYYNKLVNTISLQHFINDMSSGDYNIDNNIYFADYNNNILILDLRHDNNNFLLLDTNKMHIIQYVNTKCIFEFFNDKTSYLYHNNFKLYKNKLYYTCYCSITTKYLLREVSISVQETNIPRLIFDTHHSFIYHIFDDKIYILENDIYVSILDIKTCDVIKQYKINIPLKSYCITNGYFCVIDNVLILFLITNTNKLLECSLDCGIYNLHDFQFGNSSITQIVYENMLYYFYRPGSIDVIKRINI